VQRLLQPSHRRIVSLPQQRRAASPAVPGDEQLFVDYAGQTAPMVDPTKGEIRRAQVLVSVMGASNHTYACATRQQTVADWV